MSLPAPPKHRKSPVKHVVHKHVRENRPVRQYVRGHGAPPKTKVIKLGINNYLAPDGTGYDVMIVYDGKDSENLNVDAKTFIDALDKSFTERKNTNAVRSVTLRSLSQ
jgi:hypothetical protein